MPTAPTYVRTPQGVDYFNPYPDGPQINSAGVYIADQPTLDAVFAAAARVPITLYTSDTGPTPHSVAIVDPFIRYDTPQPELSPAEQAQAQDNIGSTGGGGSTITDNGDGTATDSDSGVTFYTKTQSDTNLGGKQAHDATLDAFAGLAGSADKVPYFTASDVLALMTVTAAARGLLDDTSTAAMLTTLGAAATTDARFAPSPTSTDGNRGVRVNSAGTGYELGNRHASAGYPSYAPMGLTKAYNPLGFYGIQDVITPLRAKLGATRAGLARTDIALIGDSVSAGYFGSSAAKPNDPAHSWPLMMRDAGIAAGIPWGGTGFVSPSQNLLNTAVGDICDPRWSFGTPANWDCHKYGLYATCAAGAGNTATLTSPYGGCTNVDIIVDNQKPNCTYAIFNSAGVSIRTGSFAPNSTNTLKKISETGLTDAKSVTITTVAGTNFIYPVNIYKATGLQVHNLAFVSAIMSGASGWENTGAVYNGADQVALTALPTLDALLILGGGNDRFNAYTDSAITTGITNIFAKWGANAPTKIFMGHSQAASWTNTQMASFTASYWSMCEAQGFGFIDTYQFFGTYAVLNAAGVMQDATGGQTHPNQGPSVMLGSLMAEWILGAPGPTNTLPRVAFSSTDARPIGLPPGAWKVVSATEPTNYVDGDDWQDT